MVADKMGAKDTYVPSALKDYYRAANGNVNKEANNDSNSNMRYVTHCVYLLAVTFLGIILLRICAATQQLICEIFILFVGGSQNSKKK